MNEAAKKKAAAKAAKAEAEDKAMQDSIAQQTKIQPVTVSLAELVHLKKFDTRK